MDFTNDEKERINQLYGNGFNDLTPDDAELIGRWEAWKAVTESEHQAKLDAIHAETQAKLEAVQAESAKALENLEALHQAALARLEGIDGK